MSFEDAVKLPRQAVAAEVDRASSWTRSRLVSPLAAAGATRWLPSFSSRLEGERRSDDRRELYCCEAVGWSLVLELDSFSAALAKRIRFMQKVAP